MVDIIIPILQGKKKTRCKVISDKLKPWALLSLVPYFGGSGKLVRDISIDVFCKENHYRFQAGQECL